MSEPINLQEAILKEVRRDKIPVTLFLMNGFQLRQFCGGVGQRWQAADDLQACHFYPRPYEADQRSN